MKSLNRSSKNFFYVSYLIGLFTNVVFQNDLQRIRIDNAVGSCRVLRRPYVRSPTQLVTAHARLTAPDEHIHSQCVTPVCRIALGQFVRSNVCGANLISRLSWRGTFTGCFVYLRGMEPFIGWSQKKYRKWSPSVVRNHLV